MLWHDQDHGCVWEMNVLLVEEGRPIATERRGTLSVEYGSRGGYEEPLGAFAVKCRPLAKKLCFMISRNEPPFLFEGVMTEDSGSYSKQRLVIRGEFGSQGCQSATKTLIGHLPEARGDGIEQGGRAHPERRRRTPRWSWRLNYNKSPTF